MRPGTVARPDIGKRVSRSQGNCIHGILTLGECTTQREALPAARNSFSAFAHARLSITSRQPDFSGILDSRTNHHYSRLVCLFLPHGAGNNLSARFELCLQLHWMHVGSVRTWLRTFLLQRAGDGACALPVYPTSWSLQLTFWSSVNRRRSDLPFQLRYK